MATNIMKSIDDEDANLLDCAIDVPCEVKTIKDYAAEQVKKVKDPLDIYFDIPEDKMEELSNDEEGEYTHKFDLEFYDKMDKAHYYNRSSDFPELSERKSMIRSNFKFAMAFPGDILKAINSGAEDIHEIPRYDCSLFFDLDDKENKVFSDKNNMLDVFISFMKEMFDPFYNRKFNKHIKPFDPSKLIIHCDSEGLNSMHIIYDNDGKVFYNMAYLRRFMGLVKNVAGKEKWGNISKVIDFNVYDENHSLRTIGSVKNDKHGCRKFIKYYLNKDGKLRKSKNQKITKKDIISKESSCYYNIKIHTYGIRFKKICNPSKLSKSNNLSERFASFAPDTYLSSEVNDLFAFNAMRGISYQCPACGTEHTSNGWYGFLRGGKAYAGCHGSEYKQNPEPKLLFTLNMKECAKNGKKYEESNIREEIHNLLDKLDAEGCKPEKEWSFCDYTKFIRKKNIKLEDIVEYLATTVIHIINKGNHVIRTKNILNKVTSTCLVENVFTGHNDIMVSVDKFGLLSMNEIYYKYIYNYCSYDYLEFRPYLIEEKNEEIKKLYNLFNGYPHKYEKLTKEQMKEYKNNELKPILDHINVLSGQSLIISLYVIYWIAFIIQFPTKKNKVALAFYSKKEQVGKNILWDWIVEKVIGGALSRSVSGMEQITGRFNAASEGMLLTLCNEMSAYNKGYKCGFIRNLITEILREIERKGCESYKINDYGAYVFLTNHYNFMNIKPGDKHYMMVRVDESKQGDFEYFDKLAECMEKNAGLFFNYLANIDLSKFRVTDIPVTQMKKDLMEDNQSAPLKFIKFLVDKGEEEMYDYLGMDDDDEDCIISLYKVILKADLYDKYKIWHEKETEYSHKKKGEFYRELKDSGVIVSNIKKEKISGRPWHVNINYADLKAVDDQTSVF